MEAGLMSSYTVTIKGDDIDAKISITDYKSYQAILSLLDKAYDDVATDRAVL